MDLHLEGKVVILTGGFKGIGKGMDALNTRVRDDGDDFDVIDAHFHIWDPAVRRLDWLAGDDGTLNRRWIMDDLAAYYGPFAAQGVRFLGGVRVMGLWGTRLRHVDRRERRSVCRCRFFASISSHGRRSGARLWTL